jgi:hypothetical protein
VSGSATSTPRSIICDAGGILVVSGALTGTAPGGVEILALDWSAVTVARFLAVRHQGNAVTTRVEIGIALTAVHEWFPVRSLVTETIERAGVNAVDALDSWSALLLAEQLDLPLLTASDEISSSRITVIRPW